MEKETREEGENRTREPEGLGPEPSAFDRFATSPPAQKKPCGGLEPPTPRLKVACSTD